MVKWNQTEKSWDCPCHGARYNIEGAVITGPSVMALERIELDLEESQASREAGTVK